VKGQKECVVELVKHYLPNFVEYKDIALIMLTHDQREKIKNSLAVAITLGDVTYSKDPLNKVEVTAYARSCVMNHLKKAKELNGNQVYGQTQETIEAKKEQKKLSGIDMDSLPNDLKALVRGLV